MGFKASPQFVPSFNTNQDFDSLVVLIYHYQWHILNFFQPTRAKQLFKNGFYLLYKDCA